MMGVSLAENTYDDPYDLAVTDPLFLTAAAAAHTGRWSLLDALWWEWHPEEPAPSGSPSPIFRLRALQRRVYDADGDAAGDLSVAQKVRELEVEIAAERAAITETIAAARADLELRTAARPHLDPALGDPVGTRAGSTTAAPAIPPVDAEDATGRAAARPTRGRLLLALILVAALIVAAVLGGVLGNRLTVTGLGAESPTPSAGGYLSTHAVESASPATGPRLYWESPDFLTEMGPALSADDGADDLIGDVSVAWGRTGEATSP
nr:hypothetical protein BJQ95_00818 [Cryobacterium sp. SO1]